MFAITTNQRKGPMLEYTSPKYHKKTQVFSSAWSTHSLAMH